LLNHTALYHIIILNVLQKIMGSELHCKIPIACFHCAAEQINFSGDAQTRNSY
jgi:hypothetical protein